MSAIKPFDSEDYQNAKIMLTNKCVVNAVAEYLERRGYSKNTNGNFTVSFNSISPGKVEAIVTIGFDGKFKELKKDEQDSIIELELD